jgi:hypothetical protein
VIRYQPRKPLSEVEADALESDLAGSPGKLAFVEVGMFVGVGGHLMTLKLVVDHFAIDLLSRESVVVQIGLLEVA